MGLGGISIPSSRRDVGTSTFLGMGCTPRGQVVPEEGRNDAVPGDGFSSVSNYLHATGGSKRRRIVGKQQPSTHDPADKSAKRKAEADVDIEEERKMRRPMFLKEFRVTSAGKQIAKLVTIA